MVVRTVAALLGAQARNFWNRALRDTGKAGTASSAVAVVVVAVVLAIPAVMTLRAGWGIGREMAAGDRAAGLGSWCWLQALFTVLFGLLGGVRHQLSFTLRDVGVYPIPRLALLAAEIPASVFEVFPLLGTAGMACLSLGVALAMPRAAPLVAVLAVSGWLQMLLLQHLAGSLKRLGRKRFRSTLVLGALVVAATGAAVVQSGADPRPALRAATGLVVEWAPGSIGARGMTDILAGAWSPGLARLGLACALLVPLAALTALVHARELATEASGARLLRGPRGSPLGGRPEVALGRLFVKQLLATWSGRALVLVPVLMSGALAVLQWAATQGPTPERGQGLPDQATAAIGRLMEQPLLELLVFVLLWFSHEIWLNQFGWDRQGLRTLFVLPLSTPQLLLGKLLGMACLTMLQVLLAGTLLLVCYRPTVREVLCTLGGAGAVFIAAVAAGHLFSARFPRAITATGSSSLPISQSWMPVVGFAAVAGPVAALQRAAGALGPWAPPSILILLLLAAAAGYRTALPAMARVVDGQRERLLGM